MKIYAFSFQNLKGRPNEDYYLTSKKYPIFAVADGVSRIRNPNGSYPKLSGARSAAEEFCRTTVKHLEKNYSKASVSVIKKGMDSANRAIFRLNEKYGINKNLDYLRNDYFCACGVTAVIERGILYYGYAGDCGVRIYNKNDLLKLISIDDVSPLEEHRDSLSFKSENERRIFWRKVLRNKPKAPYLTYGVFTGEPEVATYYHLGKIKLNSGDLIFLYSDGFFYFIKKAEFRMLFRKYKEGKLKEKIKVFTKKEIAKNTNQKTSETFGDDKTLISILI